MGIQGQIQGQIPISRMLKKLVLASGNPGKLREIRALLDPLGIEVQTQDELGIGEAEEPHPTFIENALAKARHASRKSALPALADDSGLCVHALKGAPGVDSAYYAARAGTREERDARNNAKLLQDLRDQSNRAAHYVCIMALVRYPLDPEPIIAQASWHGEIAPAPRGSGGFGYDPLFLVPGRDCTAAQLESAKKNRLSHRGLALQALLAQLQPSG